MPAATTQYEKRGVAPAIPIWIPDACTQCNYCAIVCPHAVIRPFLLNKQEKEAAPEAYVFLSCLLTQFRHCSLKKWPPHPPRSPYPIHQVAICSSALASSEHRSN